MADINPQICSSITPYENSQEGEKMADVIPVMAMYIVVVVYIAPVAVKWAWEEIVPIAKQALKWAWEQILPILYWAWKQIKLSFELSFLLSQEVKSVKEKLQAINSNLNTADAMRLTADEEEFDRWESELRDLAFKAKVVIEIFKYATPCDGGDYFKLIIGYVCQIRALWRLQNEINDFNRKHARLPVEAPNFRKRSREDGKTSIPLREKGGPSSRTEEDVIVGFKEEEEKLRRWLTENQRLGWHVIVSIWGTAGAGKTSLAHKIYKNSSVTSQFDCVAWVSVSHRCDIKQIEFLFPKRKGMKLHKVDINTMEKNVHFECLEGQDYLIILDDVCEEKDFDKLIQALPKSPKKKSRILVTSRTNEVGGRATYPLHLRTLRDPEDMVLFLNNVYENAKDERVCVSVSTKEKDCCARKILQFCNGLPIAIVVLARMLRWRRDDVREWERVSDHVYEELVSGREIEEIRKVIRPSYIELPCRLRSCFLYLGLFPEDSMIDCDKLIRLWLAEGFLEQQGDNDDSTMENVAKRCLNDLIQRSMIQVVESKNGKPPKCYTQNLIRDFAIQEAKKTKFSSIFEKQPLEWVEDIHRIALNLKESEVHGTSTTLPRDSQSLSHLVSSSEYLSKFFRYPNNVHSFLYFSKANPQFGFQQFPLLRVLDLEGAEQMEEVPNEIRKLNLLRYLSLRGTRVERIPSWIANLRNLQTLDTPTSEIPLGALKLRQLRYLFADSFYDPSSSTHRLCIEIGVLKHLHTLELHDITSCKIIGSKTLTNLKFQQVRDGERILLRASYVKPRHGNPTVA